MYRWISRTCFVAAGTALLSLSALAQTPEPISQPFRVNTTDDSQQYSGSIARSANGDFVVVWSSEDYPLYQTSLRAQRIRVDGTPVGDEILIDVDTSAATSSPRVAMDADGNFVVVWGQGPNFIPDGDRDIKARRYDASGMPLGAETTVNAFFTGQQNLSDVAMHDSGSFVVVWGSEGSDGDVLAQRFDSVGQPVGGSMEVVADSVDFNTRPRIAMDASGDMVVVWQHRPSTGNIPRGLEARRFASNGQPQGGSFEVTPLGVFSQSEIGIDRADAGGFVVSWSSYLGQPEDNEVFARVFEADATPLGDAFRVNTYTTSYQLRPDVAMDADGAFQVVWVSDSEGLDQTVSGQRFRSDGSRQGDEWKVNVDAISFDASPQVSSAGADNVLVVWNSENPSDEIRGRLFRIGIFGDGFESGDTSAWSTSTP